MKFSTPLYTLLAASSALANALPQKREMTIIDMKNSCNSELIEQNKECVAALETLSDLEQNCASYKSEKCQKFFTELVPTVSSCGIANGQLTVENVKKMLDSICATDENNKLCPVIASINDSNSGKNVNEEEDYHKTYSKNINDTCKSKVCTDSTYTFLEFTLGTEGLADYQNTVFNKTFDIYEANPHGDSDYYAMAFLKSDYCAQQHLKTENTASTSQPQNAQPQNAQSSNASTINYSIMLTLVALCFALF